MKVDAVLPALLLLKMERADSVAESVGRAESCDVEAVKAVTLSKVTEGAAVALFGESVAMDLRLRGSGFGGSRGRERGASWLFLCAA